MDTRGRAETCFLLACLILVGPYVYFDLVEGVRIVPIQTAKTVWLASAALMFAVLAVGRCFGRNLIGSIACVIFAPVALLAVSLLLLWHGISPIREKEIKYNRDDIGGNVV